MNRSPFILAGVAALMGAAGVALAAAASMRAAASSPAAARSSSSCTPPRRSRSPRTPACATAPGRALVIVGFVMEAGAALFVGRTRDARVHRRAHFSLRRSDRRLDDDPLLAGAGGRVRGGGEAQALSVGATRAATARSMRFVISTACSPPARRGYGSAAGGRRMRPSPRARPMPPVGARLRPAAAFWRLVDIAARPALRRVAASATRCARNAGAVDGPAGHPHSGATPRPPAPPGPAFVRRGAPRRLERGGRRLRWPGSGGHHRQRR